VDYVFGVRDVAQATPLTPNTQSTPPKLGSPTYYNISTMYHIAVNHSLMLLHLVGHLYYSSSKGSLLGEPL
jgi:hypothetical protein